MRSPSGGPRPRRSGRSAACRLTARLASLLTLAAAGSVARGGAALPAGRWLEIETRPATAVVHGSPGSADALLHVSIRNLSGRPLKLVRARASYFRGQGAVGAAAHGGGGLGEASFLRLPVGLSPSERLDWQAICLEGVPEGAHRVRLEFDVLARRGARRHWRTEAVESRLEETVPVVLHLPFEAGFWKVTQGHGCRTQHRLGGRGQEFAWDFVALGPAGQGSGAARDRAWKNRDLPTFGRPVRAPAAGRVVRVVNDVPDNEGAREYPRRSLLDDLAHPDWVFGNYVVLEAGKGAYVLLAHLEQGSVLVAPGQLVEAGEQIARAGNSGNSIHPHVHLHVMDRPDPSDNEVQGLPASLADYREITIVSSGPHTDYYARHVAVGDPPEGAVVAPVPRPEPPPVTPPPP